MRYNRNQFQDIIQEFTGETEKKKKVMDVICLLVSELQLSHIARILQ